MGRRVGQLSGLLAFTLAIGRLGRLLEGGDETAPWQLILVASAFLGGVAWWLLSQLSSNRAVKLSVFAAGAVLLVLRISVPSTLIAGFLPATSTPEALGAEFDLAWRTIQTGIPPVEPFAGLLAVIAVGMWAGGALYTWGRTGGPNAAMFVPALVLYYQFAVFDRSGAGFGWLLLSTVALALAVVSMALERREETGRARDDKGRPLSRRSVTVAAAMASILGIVSIAVASSASDIVDEYGNAPWRRGDGLGPGPGSGVSYDGLVELRQRILNQSEVPVFTARFASDTPDEVNPYWKVDTLDAFDGVEWSRSDTTSRRYESDSPVVDSENHYRGTTVEVLQTVQIQALSSVLAPTAGIPIEVQDPAEGVDSPRLASEFYAVGGVSLAVTGGLDRLDQYQVRTAVIDRITDLGALATDESGDLSPIFAAARAQGAFPYQPGPTAAGRASLDGRERYLELPDNTPAGIGNRARVVTAGSSTDFEAAWMLQSWFRDQGNFEYSVEVSTGHDALILDDWLNDTTSTNYRTGYCEQFAAAMAVLARSLGIPSRVVWGFTPGEVDGNGVVTVRDTNAHAWVELWIEPYGWFPFDPTPRAEQTGFDSQPPSITAGLDPTVYLESPEDNPTVVTAPPGIGPESFEELAPDAFDVGGGGTPRWWLIGLVVLVPLAGSIPVFKTWRRRRRLAMVRNGDITAAWDEIIDRLTDLGVEVSPAQTPVELAHTTDRVLLPLAHSYASTIYGGRTGQAREVDLTGVEWWIHNNFEGPQRLMAAFNLRSLLVRD